MAVKKDRRWNFDKEQPKEHGCWACEHNPMGMGICELTGREIPLTYCLQNVKPTWCPKGGKK